MAEVAGDLLPEPETKGSLDIDHYFHHPSTFRGCEIGVLSTAAKLPSEARPSCTACVRVLASWPHKICDAADLVEAERWAMKCYKDLHF